LLALNAALDQLNACRISGDNEALSALLTQLDGLVLRVERWPDSFFDGILKLLGDETFLKLRDSWNLTYFINNNWEQLTEEQRGRLRDSLVVAFDRYDNWMGAFVTSEIFGERYADKPALKALTELARTAKMPARGTVPHGLETFARTTQDESLRGLAIKELQDLTQSPIHEVQQEASLSIQKLGRPK
jgi:uncharacterized membrane protein